MNKHIPIDVPKIQEIITEKHKKFIDDFGPITEKVASDHRLMTDIILARMFQVAVCFKEASIIDEASIKDQKPLKSVCITKSGYDNYIYMTTNGEIIVIEGFGYMLGFESDMIFPKIRINGVNDENYDWTEFSILLLDYIHNVIYERKRASETKITTMFRDNM